MPASCQLSNNYIADAWTFLRKLGAKLTPELILVTGAHGKCVDHKNTFPDTHRHFHLATEISRICHIGCEGAELQNSNLKNTTCLDTQPMHNSEFSLDSPLFLTHVFVNNYTVYTSTWIYIYIYIYVRVYIYIYFFFIYSAWNLYMYIYIYMYMFVNSWPTPFNYSRTSESGSLI